jgi:hypothetical protein
MPTIRYQQTFNALPPGMWKNNIDQAKIVAHPENAQVAANCGSDGSNCFRVVYRHRDGIHKAPPSNPVFVTSPDGVISWAASDATHTNTATDVTQSNIAIDGSTNDLGKDSNPPVPSKNYTLTYNVYFEPGFDFAKGGKLPGLASKMYDSGCTEDGNKKRRGTNWSVRLMWRANGRVELYSYDQSRPSGSCGINRLIDAVPGESPYEVPGQIPNDGKFRFQPGVWYTIIVSVKMNDNNAVIYQTDSDGKFVLDSAGDPVVLGGNGAIYLKIRSADGLTERTLLYSNVALRDECNGTCPSPVPDTPDTWVNAVFFSTFFGGNETKRTTCLGATPPSYPGLTQQRYDQLCASQRNPEIYPTMTWNPQTPSAARFDNIKVVEGYLGDGDAQSPAAPATTLSASGSPSAKVSADMALDDAKQTKYNVTIKNVGTASMSGFSARIYFDISEVVASGRTISNVTCSERYDPAGASCTLIPYRGNVYYANLTFGSFSLAAGASVNYKVTLHLNDYSNNWNSANDYSRTGLGSSTVETARIPVYQGTTLISGSNP